MKNSHRYSAYLIKKEIQKQKKKFKNSKAINRHQFSIMKSKSLISLVLEPFLLELQVVLNQYSLITNLNLDNQENNQRKKINQKIHQII